MLMLDYALNIVGSEWIIIIFVALVLILGTNKLPEAAKKLGKAVNEYNKAKDGIQNQMKDFMIFSGNSNPSLVEKICKYLQVLHLSDYQSFPSHYQDL